MPLRVKDWICKRVQVQINFATWSCCKLFMSSALCNEPENATVFAAIPWIHYIFCLQHKPLEIPATITAVYYCCADAETHELALFCSKMQLTVRLVITVELLLAFELHSSRRGVELRANIPEGFLLFQFLIPEWLLRNWKQLVSPTASKVF